MMIIEMLLSIIFSVVSALLYPLQIVFEPLGSMLGLVELLSYASVFISLPTFGLCLGIWFTFQSVRFLIVAFNWIIAKIPGVE